LRRFDIPDITARASFVKIFPKSLRMIINDMCSALCSKDKEVLQDSLGGIIVLLRQKRKEVKKAIKIIAENIKYRTEADLSMFLSVFNNIVKDNPEYLDDVILSDVGCGLNRLISETDADDDDSENDVHKKEMCRTSCVELASTLRRYFLLKNCKIPDFVEEWELISQDSNEVAEIRNAWRSCI
jgi:hypothetical protein